MNLGCRPMYDETTNMSKQVFSIKYGKTQELYKLVTIVFPT